MNKKALRANLILSWVYLLVSVLITATGSDFFKFDESELQPLIKVSIIIENNLVLNIIVAAAISLFLNYFTLLAILDQRKFTKKQIFIFVPIVLGASISSWFSPILQILFNIAYFTVPIIFLKKKFYRVFIGFGVISAFELGLLFIRQVGGWYISPSTSVYASITLQLDMFFIVLMYYMYSIRKELK